MANGVHVFDEMMRQIGRLVVAHRRSVKHQAVKPAKNRIPQHRAVAEELREKLEEEGRGVDRLSRAVRALLDGGTKLDVLQAPVSSGNHVWFPDFTSERIAYRCTSCGVSVIPGFESETPFAIEIRTGLQGCADFLAEEIHGL